MFRLILLFYSIEDVITVNGVRLIFSYKFKRIKRVSDMILLPFRYFRLDVNKTILMPEVNSLIREIIQSKINKNEKVF